jgi:hypothetical protein
MFSGDTGIMTVKSTSGFGTIWLSDQAAALYAGNTSTFLDSQTNTYIRAGGTSIMQMQPTYLNVSQNTYFGAIGFGAASARVDIASATTAIASLRIRSGATVSSPNDGDIWNDGLNLWGKFGGQVRVLDSGSTVGGSGSTTYVQPGLNTYTGGTSSAPTVNISAATLNFLSATTITGSTLYTQNTGIVILTGGTAVVNTTKITANSNVFLNYNDNPTNIGILYENKPSRSAGVSFTINSSNPLDTSTVAWFIIEPSA